MQAMKKGRTLVRGTLLLTASGLALRGIGVLFQSILTRRIGRTLVRPINEIAETARDYVQSGLVAMWDGIENAGWGTHDPNATTWKNLKGDTAWDMSVRAAWQSGGGLYFDGTWCGIAPKTSEQYVTMECVCDGVQESHLLAFGWSYQGMKKRYSLLANASTSLLRCYVVAGVLDGTYTDAR